MNGYIPHGWIWMLLMREKNIPLFALESQDPVKDFDFLGITLQYEMCYTNVLADSGSVRNPASCRSAGPGRIPL